MASGAAHLVDRVLAEVTVRQWVLSVPWPRRYLFAARPDVCAGVRRRVWRELSRWYERRVSGRWVARRARWWWSSGSGQP